MADPQRRRRTLIQPRLQLWLTGAFVGLSALALLLQFALFTNAVHGIALELPSDGEIMMEAFSGDMLVVLAVSGLVFLPLTFLIGVLLTFRIAGPLCRIERFLLAVAEGESVPDVQLRRKDRLASLADAVNLATARLRGGDAAPSSSAAPATVERREAA